MLPPHVSEVRLPIQRGGYPAPQTVGTLQLWSLGLLPGLSSCASGAYAQRVSLSGLGRTQGSGGPSWLHLSHQLVRIYSKRVFSARPGLWEI